MKTRIKIEIVLSIMVIVFGLYGCSFGEKEGLAESESNIELSERQEHILTEMGLTTDFEELTLSQQNAIMAIEKMLQYAEEKYNEEFAYSGYVPTGNLEVEHMFAYPVSGDSGTDSFTITRTDTGFDDDYINVLIDTSFNQYVLSGISELFPESSVIVFTSVYSTTLTELPEENVDYDGNVSGNYMFFFDSSLLDEGEIEVFNKVISDWMEKHSLYGEVQLILLKESILKDLTKYNYTDFLSDDYYLSREVLYFDLEE